MQKKHWFLEFGWIFYLIWFYAVPNLFSFLEDKRTVSFYYSLVSILVLGNLVIETGLVVFYCYEFYKVGRAEQRLKWADSTAGRIAQVLVAVASILGVVVTFFSTLFGVLTTPSYEYSNLSINFTNAYIGISLAVFAVAFIMADRITTQPLQAGATLIGLGCGSLVVLLVATWSIFLTNLLFSLITFLSGVVCILDWNNKNLKAEADFEETYWLDEDNAKDSNVQ